MFIRQASNTLSIENRLLGNTLNAQVIDMLQIIIRFMAIFHVYFISL